MQGVGVWQVVDPGPQKLEASSIDLEKNLETWIERDPGLLRQGLQIIGRQVSTEAGPLDLLALDLQGRWILIELKKGKVRRETVGQALDYASCVADLPFEELEEQINGYLAKKENGKTLRALLKELGVDTATLEAPRDVSIVIVGIGCDRGLDRIVAYLDRLNVPVAVVSFQVFELPNKERILVREITETVSTPQTRLPARTVEEILERADQLGIGTVYRRIHKTAVGHGMFARGYAYSIMYTPPQHHGRCLLYPPMKPTKDGKLRVYVATETFAEFYAVDGPQAERILGAQGFRLVDATNVEELVGQLDRFFEAVARASDAEEGA